MHKGNAYLSCLSRQDAQKVWKDRLTEAGYFSKLPLETLPVTQSRGRVSAECLYARQSVPHYNGAAMDGIAVRAQDTFGAAETTPCNLTVRKAGEEYTPGSCYVVDTGDAMPDGTDAVIMIEDVFLSGSTAQIMAAAVPWQHVRIIGEDIVVKEMVLPEHHPISPSDLAALLAAGLTEINVVARPKVAVIPTGSELVESWQDLTPGAILDINSHMLCAAVSEWGGNPIRHAIVRDDLHALRQAVAESLEQADMVITNAGTSAGTEDYTSTVLGQLGEVLVHGVAIKPGKPVVLAICRGKPVIGLPGYSVSAMLTAELFVRDVLYARQAMPSPDVRTESATLSRNAPSGVGVEEYLRVSLGNVQGKLVAAPIGRGAGAISTLVRAQGIVAVPPESAGIRAGEHVGVRLLRDRATERSLLSIGSHDMALEVLSLFLRRRAGITLSCANVGSMGGIMAVRNDEAHIAGIHLLDPETGIYNESFPPKYLQNKTWRLVHFAMRRQGLIVPPGNPMNITGLADLARPGLRYINRQRGSGTRMLLDYHLVKLGLDAEQIDGYQKEVSTHMAVAATIAAGAGDAGLGILAAAEALGLDFVSVGDEQYDLLLNFAPGDERAEHIIAILQSEEFRREVEGLGGYDLRDSGKVIADSLGGRTNGL